MVITCIIFANGLEKKFVQHLLNELNTHGGEVVYQAPSEQKQVID